jgi:glycosyltransferase involved in cell wall biosynthesis
MIKISVVIPTFNRCSILERTLPTVLAQEYPADSYEVIVVVDGSTDGTNEFLQSIEPSHSQLKVVQAGHCGPSAARNLGIHAAAGELILFLDDDLQCPSDLLKQHVDAHPDVTPIVAHGPIYVTPGSTKSIIRHVTENFYDQYYHALSSQMELRHPDRIEGSLSVLSSLVNSSIPRVMLLACEGFDEEIIAAEDLELGLRLYKQGCIFRFLPSTVTHEYYIKTTRQYLRGQVKATAAGDRRASRKHPEYRVHSALAGLAQTPWRKKFLMHFLVRFPLSPVPLLAFPFLFEEWLDQFAFWHKLGTSLLRVTERIVRLRTALLEAGSWNALESEFGRQCPVLLYHHVGPLRPGMYASLNVSARDFERQMRWLARHGYKGICTTDWLRWVREGKGLPEKPIIITFDDAYDDIAEYAFPALRKYGFAGVVYVVTQRVAETNKWDERNGSGTLRVMTWEQIRSWAEQGIEFGGHSRTHANLPTLSREMCTEEVAGCRKDLEAALCATVRSFAYPYGEFNETVHDVVSRQFPLAFSTIEGMNYLGDDLHLLKRIYVGPKTSLIGFATSVRRGKNLRWWDDLRIKLALRTRFKKAFGG